MTVSAGPAESAENHVPGMHAALADPSAFDRFEVERSRPGLLAEVHADPRTRIVVASGGRVGLDASGALHLSEPGAVDVRSVRAFLGRRAGVPLLLALVGEPDATSFDPPGGWGELRAMGADLSPDDGAILVTARALGVWIAESAFCPACGGRAELSNAGWSRRCTSCGREHFPRTDPAVIVAVSDGERLLLGANAAWPAGRYSCFAGFIEAGESAEATVGREIREESGVTVSELEYLGSQAWPYPRSLMLGFVAHTDTPGDARPDGEEIVEVRWFTATEIGTALADPDAADFTLPGPASIARRLIRTWHDRVTGDAG